MLLLVQVANALPTKTRTINKRSLKILATCSKMTSELFYTIVQAEICIYSDLKKEYLKHTKKDEEKENSLMVILISNTTKNIKKSFNH